MVDPALTSLLRPVRVQGIAAAVTGSQVGSYATRRRRVLRSRARRERSGATFWSRFLPMLSRCIWGHSSPDGSSTSSPFSARAALDDVDTGVCPHTSVAMLGAGRTGKAKLCESIAGECLEMPSDLCRPAAAVRAILGPADRVDDLGTLSVGADCCGLCTMWHALSHLGVKCRFLFASDISKSVRKLISNTCPPDVWYSDVMDRDSFDPAVPRVGIYSAGFPCQPFSSAGLRLGMLDARGTVFYACVQYIGAKRQSLFVLENVKGLLSHDGGATFEHVMTTLREIGDGAYNVEYSLLNTETQGLPHHRPRVFIVGRLLSICRQAFQFPSALPKVSLDTILEPRGSPCDRDPSLKHLSAMAQSNLADALKELREQGHDPLKVNFIVDVDASSVPL